MKRLLLLMICMLTSFSSMAQQRAEYNRKGDEAMRRQDYFDAKMWYEEGVAQCDKYSIEKLTSIWLSNERMRPSMRSIMNKCLNCLNVLATEDDLEAIDKLVVYYTNGIGTPKSEELASYWKDYREKLLQPKETVGHVVDTIVVSQDRGMRLFAAYSYSIESPYGITVGGIGKSIGWYVRFKTNMSFNSHTDECNNRGEIINFSNSDKESYEINNSKSSKKNSYQATAGIVVKCLPWLYTSVGFGYGQRALLHPFTTHSYDNHDQTRELWCKNIDSSYSGVAAEADLMVKVTNSIFVSVGCNTVNFKFIDLNAGVGVFF